MRSIYQIYGQDAHAMTIRLLEASNAASLLQAGTSVALKPNLVLAGNPDDGATTHAGVLSGCMAYFRDCGIQDISVIESSWVGAETMQAMRRAGYDDLCRYYGVPFYDLKRDRTRPVRTAVGEIDVCVRALEAGLLVDLPVLKGHCQTGMTCALKNLKGCLPDREKRRFHAMGLQKPIAALGAALKPGLIVVDNICGDLDFEEGGTPVRTNRMFLGTDAVQLDAYGAQLMGLRAEDIPYIGLAEQYGGGSTKVKPEDIIDLNRPEGNAINARREGKVARLTRHVHEDKACSACFASLVRALHARGGDEREIYIGQGWRGHTPDGLGIGSCLRGAKVCVPGCPPTAEAIANALDGKF